MNIYKHAFGPKSLLAILFAITSSSAWAAELSQKDVKPIEPPPRDTVTVTGQRPPKFSTFEFYQFLGGSSGSGAGSGKGSGSTGDGTGGGKGGENPKPAPPDNSDDCNKTPNPVVIATGEKVKAEVDFSSFGLHGFSLTRTYRSKNASGILFGPNWPSSLDPVVLQQSTQKVSTEAGLRPARATLKFPGGVKYTYTIDPANGNTYLYQAVHNEKWGASFTTGTGVGLFTTSRKSTRLV